MRNSLKPVTLLAITLCGSAAADTIYSNLLDSPIPTNFTGTFMTVDGGTVNPFFGGVGVANNNLFQPVRDGTGNLDTIQNLSVGATVDASLLFSTGYGGSQDHLGSTFTAGQEGVIGFKTGNGNYGWMRVVFTANTGGAVIKDWAYDNSGAAIVVGRVQQSAASAGAQLVTLSPGSSESFTLGSTLTNTGGNINSVLKTGTGTTILGGINSYTGTTTVSAGALLVRGSTHADSTVTVEAAGTLGGTGDIGGAVNVSGVLSPGELAIGALTTGDLTMASGSTLAYEAVGNGAAGADLLKVEGSLSILGVNLYLSNADLDGESWELGDKITLISYEGDAVTSGFNGYSDDTNYGFGSNLWRFNYNDTMAGANFADQATGGYFVTMTLVPEPGCALLAGLGALTLLRRRREMPVREASR